MRKIGLAVTGSFCTFANLLVAVDDLVAHEFDITPIFSFNVSNLDTRFLRQKISRKQSVKKRAKLP